MPSYGALTMVMMILIIVLLLVILILAMTMMMTMTMTLEMTINIKMKSMMNMKINLKLTMKITRTTTTTTATKYTNGKQNKLLTLTGVIDELSGRSLTPTASVCFSGFPLIESRALDRTALPNEV